MRITFTLSEDENVALDYLAKKADMSKAEWLRTLIRTSYRAYIALDDIVSKKGVALDVSTEAEHLRGCVVQHTETSD